MKSTLEPPGCSIEWLQLNDVPLFYDTIEPNFKSKGGLLRERSLEEIIRDIQQYFVVRVEEIIVGAFQLQESLTEERFLELWAFVVCSTQKEERKKVKEEIIDFSLIQAKEKVLQLISLSTHPSLRNLYEKKGALKSDLWTFPLRESISPNVPLYVF